MNKVEFPNVWSMKNYWVWHRWLNENIGSENFNYMTDIDHGGIQGIYFKNSEDALRFRLTHGM